MYNFAAKRCPGLEHRLRQRCISLRPRFQILCIDGDFKRECLAMVVDTPLPTSA